MQNYSVDIVVTFVINFIIAHQQKVGRAVGIAVGIAVCNMIFNFNLISGRGTMLENPLRWGHVSP